MEKVCPLCNALEIAAEKCPSCGALLVDSGALNSYLGPYSPYMNSDELPFGGQEYCVHLLHCPICAYDTRLTVFLVTV
jgi:hypothetical protein